MVRNYIEFFRTRTAHTTSSLALCYAGRESCRPGHRFGPASRAHYLIHFILRGKGYFTCKGISYSLGPNQLFVIRPGETSYYVADEEDPWEYMWVAFLGTDATSILQNCGLLNETPIADFSPVPRLLDALEDTITHLQEKTENDYTLLGNLYTVFGCLAANYRSTSQQCDNLYLKQALNFIHNNYNHHIKVQDMSDYLQIDRTYLYRLFVEEFGVSPKKYLVQHQLKMALQLLTNSTLSIKEISYSCGFTDPAAFSQRFSLEYGLTPRAFRHIDGSEVLSYVNKTSSPGNSPHTRQKSR